MVFRLPDGAEMLTNSGRDMPREQNDTWGAVVPATEPAPVPPDAPVPMSAGLLAVDKTTTEL